MACVPVFEKNRRLFLLSHGVGGLGLNLMGANRVVLMDVNWNPSQDTQSIFRAYRFGQTKPCYVYRLVTMGTMEEVVYERSITKLAISGRVVDERQISKHYKSEDLEQLYRLNIDLETARPPPACESKDKALVGLYEEHTAIFKYVEHQTLLENLPDEDLNEEEKKAAFDELNKEKNNGKLTVFILSLLRLPLSLKTLFLKLYSTC